MSETEITLTINKDIIELLEEWREERLSMTSKLMKKIEDSLLKNAYIANYKGIKNADYAQLVKYYLGYQVIERRYGNETEKT